MQAFETRLGIASKAAELWRSPDASIAGLLAYFSRSNGGPAGSSAVVLSPGQVDVFIAIFRRIRLRTSGLVRLVDTRAITRAALRGVHHVLVGGWVWTLRACRGVVPC